VDKQMTEAEKNGLLKNICVSENKLEDYLNAITLEATQYGQQKGKVMDKQNVIDARCEIEWVEEYIEGVGEMHKQVYIDALERVNKLLEKIEKAMDALND